MEQMQREVPTGAVHGTCEPAWSSVVDAFVANFTDRQELGASLCILHEGTPVVDVWNNAAKHGNEQP